MRWIILSVTPVVVAGCFGRADFTYDLRTPPQPPPPPQKKIRFIQYPFIAAQIWLRDCVFQESWVHRHSKETEKLIRKSRVLWSMAWEHVIRNILQSAQTFCMASEAMLQGQKSSVVLPQDVRVSHQTELMQSTKIACSAESATNALH